MSASSPLTSLTLSIHLLRLLKELASKWVEVVTCDVEDDDGSARIFDIWGYEWMKAFLSGRIPELHPQTLVLNVDSLGHEIHSHCWLPNVRRTCSLPVKLSKMNRLIIEVFPTDWSPKRTILHFTAGLFYIFSNYKHSESSAPHICSQILSDYRLGVTCEKGIWWMGCLKVNLLELVFDYILNARWGIA